MIDNTNRVYNLSKVRLNYIIFKGYNSLHYRAIDNRNQNFNEHISICQVKNNKIYFSKLMKQNLILQWFCEVSS